MKRKLLLFSMVGMIAFSACKKETEDPGTGTPPPAAAAQEQQAVMFYTSGNWCGPCGQYGKPAMKNIEANNTAKSVIISAQLNGSGQDPLNCAAANKIASFWAVTGVPTCYLGGGEGAATKIGGGTAMETTIQTKLNETVAKKAVVNSLIEKTIANGQVTVKVKAKFFQDIANQYYVGVYLIEDKIAGQQYSSNSGWAPAEFNNVIRAFMHTGTEAYGDMLADAGVKAGTVVEKSFSIPVDAKWNSANLQVAVVIFKKNDQLKFEVSNGNVK